MKVAKIALVLGVAVVCTLPAAAAPHHGRDHHHKGNDGVRLAANIIGLVNTALQGPERIIHPQPVVTVCPHVTAEPPPPPVYHCPPPQPVYHCPPPPPRPRHHRPAPPPRRHHGHGGHGRR